MAAAGGDAREADMDDLSADEFDGSATERAGESY